jgi:hypothetical protein
MRFYLRSVVSVLAGLEDLPAGGVALQPDCVELCAVLLALRSRPGLPRWHFQRVDRLHERSLQVAHFP